MLLSISNWMPGHIQKQWSVSTHCRNRSYLKIKNLLCVHTGCLEKRERHRKFKWEILSCKLLLFVCIFRSCIPRHCRWKYPICELSTQATMQNSILVGLAAHIKKFQIKSQRKPVHPKTHKLDFHMCYRSSSAFQPHCSLNNQVKIEAITLNGSKHLSSLSKSVSALMIEIANAAWF